MPAQTPDIFTVIDRVVAWVTPILAIVIGLAVYIYRDKTKNVEKKIADLKEDLEDEEEKFKKLLERESEERKRDIEAILLKIKDMESTFKEAVVDLQNAFKDGIKEERSFRNEILIQHSNNIEKLFSKLDEVSVKIGQIDQKLESHIENQKRICIINHNKSS